MHKRGEITTEQIVKLTLILIAFGILLFLYTQFSWSGVIDKQTCHQSVILRGTLDFANGAFQDVAPLKCATEKICITSGFFGGKCSDQFNNAKGITTVKVSSETDVEQTLARELVDCWDMMGQGHLSLYKPTSLMTTGFGPSEPTCVICSRIAYDKESLKNIDLKKVNIVKYMQTRLNGDKNVTYWEYLSGGRDSPPISVPSNIKFFDGLTEVKDKDSKSSLVTHDTSKPLDISLQEPTKEGDPTGDLAVIFMQASAPKKTDILKNDIQLILGGSVLAGSSYLAMPKALQGVASNGAKTLIRSPYTWFVVALAGVTQMASVQSSQMITAGYCGDVKSGDEARLGCSAVRIVPYKVSDISQYCQVIDGLG